MDTMPDPRTIQYHSPDKGIYIAYNAEADYIYIDEYMYDRTYLKEILDERLRAGRAPEVQPTFIGH